MPTLPIHVVDAFTSVPFKGNPAGVCLLKEIALDDRQMASIAAEMKHAETSFLIPREKTAHFDLRWFTPAVEVDLCGHATLAASHMLWETGEVALSEPITFHTRSGPLIATKNGAISLDFPAKAITTAPLPFAPKFLPKAVYTGHNKMDWLVQLGSEAEVRALVPDMDEIVRLGIRGLIVTAQGSGPFDFISRFFAPQAGVPEDSVTGSAHCALAPFWSERLGKSKMHAYQASERGGEVGVEIMGDRVVLSGHAVTVLTGTLQFGDASTA
jgi:PhzF family phenazine biosynthesis protein